MKGFIKITQSNNQGTCINVSNIIKFYRKTQDHTGIVTTDLVEIECKQTIEEIEIDRIFLETKYVVFV